MIGYRTRICAGYYVVTSRHLLSNGIRQGKLTIRQKCELSVKTGMGPCTHTAWPLHQRVKSCEREGSEIVGQLKTCDSKKTRLVSQDGKMVRR